MSHKQEHEEKIIENLGVCKFFDILIILGRVLPAIKSISQENLEFGQDFYSPQKFGHCLINEVLFLTRKNDFIFFTLFKRNQSKIDFFKAMISAVII